MNKHMIKKAHRLSINSDRLNDPIEQYPVEWLLKDRSVNGYNSTLEMLKGNILCMNPSNSNYQLLSTEDKEKADILMKHPEIVDHVFLTIFQWFGTNVGKHEIGELMDEIRELKRERIIFKNPMNEGYNEGYDKDQAVLEEVRKLVPDDVFKDIEFELGESENHFNYRIVEEPIKEYRDTTVCVGLPNGKYLMWDC